MSEPAPTPAPAPAPAPAPTPPWYDGVDSETLGFMQSRGLDKLDPTKAALNSIKGHREAMKLLGAPQDQLIRFPKDASDTENWNALRTRMGVPADAKEYDFSNVKFKDGRAVHERMAEKFRDAAHRVGVPKDGASELAKSWVEAMDEVDEAQHAEDTAKFNAERDALKINWGSNTQQNLLRARNAFNNYWASKGWTEDRIRTTWSNIEKSGVGYADSMEFWRDIGVRTGEDKFISSGPSGNGTLMSRAQAQATLDEKMADAQWARRLDARDATVMREWANLTQLIALG